MAAGPIAERNQGNLLLQSQFNIIISNEKL